MPTIKLLPFLALVTLALVALSSVPVPVNALVADPGLVARRAHGVHDAVARRKRDSPSTATGRCKPRSSTPTPSAPPAPSTTSAPPAPSTTSASLPPATVPPPSSTSSPPQPGTTCASGNAKKWGLAWGADPDFLGNFGCLSGVRFIYNWDDVLPGVSLSNLPCGIQYLPMVWGTRTLDSVQSVLYRGYADYVLAFNEPNIPTQSNLSPADAYGIFKQYIAPLAGQGYTIVSPACTNDPAGLEWLATFMGYCSQDGCPISIIAFHAYTTNGTDVIAVAQQLHATYNMNVMITEFADQDYSGNNDQASMGDIWAFANLIRDFVENTCWLEAAFPFGVIASLPDGVNPGNALMDGNGNPTPLACFYFTGATSC